MRAWKAVVGGMALTGLVGFTPLRADASIPFFDETAPATAAYAGPSTAQPLVGDFNGDGRTDVFLYRPGAGGEVLKEGESDRTFLTITASINVAGTYHPVVGDFDGNGVTDIFWYAPGTTADFLWLFNSSGKHTSVAEKVNGTFKPVVGDWATTGVSHDKEDIYWWAPAGADSLWRATGGGHFTSIAEPNLDGNYQPLVGAFTPNTIPGDGSTDGTLDIFWYGPGATPDHLWAGNGSGHFTSINYTVNGSYRPIVGLFDGFGVDDIFWYNPTGPDSVWLADPDLHHFTAHSTSIGPNFRPIQGNFLIPDTPIYWWSASGADTMWFPEGAPGTWDHSVFDDNTDMGAGFLPVTGDFDGDGFRDIYWIHPGGGTSPVWFGRTSTPG